MDNTLLIPIVALILGLIFGWLLARVTGRGGVNELESRVRQAQSAADGAKRDVTNLQSELNIKQTHINTLNSNIGILEEKLRLAEAGGQAEMVTITRLQGELKSASADKPAFEAELRDRDAELSRVRAQLKVQQEEAIDLWRQLQAAEAATADARSQLDAVEAENAQREALRLAAVFEAAQVASFQQDLESAQAEDQEKLGIAAGDGDKVVATLKPADADELDTARKEIFELKDGIATLAFAGAELAGAYEKRGRDYDELLAQTHRGSRTLVVEKRAPPPAPAAEESREGVSTAGKMGLVAGGAALAGAAHEHEKEATAAEAGPSAEELNAQIETLKGQYAALQADLQTETKSKADLTSELQARLTDLTGLKDTLTTAEGNLDELIGPAPKVEGEAGSAGAEASAPVGVVAKLAVVKTIVDGLKSSKADLESKLQTTSTELDGLKGQIADVTADVDGLISISPDATKAAEGAQVDAPTDLKGKLGLVKGNINNLSSRRAELEARLQSGDIELGALRKKLLSLDGVLNGILGIQAQLEETSTKGDAQAAPAAKATTGG